MDNLQFRRTSKTKYRVNNINFTKLIPMNSKLRLLPCRSPYSNSLTRNLGFKLKKLSMGMRNITSFIFILVATLKWIVRLTLPPLYHRGNIPSHPPVMHWTRVGVYIRCSLLGLLKDIWMDSKNKQKTHFFMFTWPCIVTNFFLIKPTDALIFLNLFLSRNSTCFGQFLCPSSGVFHCTFGICIRHQTCMTYTSVECTVENSRWWAEELPETCRVSWQK